MKGKYANGWRWCSRCMAYRIPEGGANRCPDCGQALRFSPKDAMRKAIFRGSLGRYSAVRP